jgi:tRNA A37 threonylcarbamoyladenosine dehydratase
MLNQFSRTQLIYGEDAMRFFASCRIAVFGIGGVGGFVVEALARSGIGLLDLIDDDRICLTNIRG